MPMSTATRKPTRHLSAGPVPADASVPGSGGGWHPEAPAAVSGPDPAVPPSYSKGPRPSSVCSSPGGLLPRDACRRSLAWRAAPCLAAAPASRRDIDPTLGNPLRPRQPGRSLCGKAGYVESGGRSAGSVNGPASPTITARTPSPAWAARTAGNELICAGGQWGSAAASLAASPSASA